VKSAGTYLLKYNNEFSLKSYKVESLESYNTEK